MPPTTHSRLSPSSSKRWMNCPGSVALSEGIPDTTSFYAAEGSAAHELLEEALREGYLDPRVLGKPWAHDGFSGEVTQDMIDAVQVAVDYVLERLEAAGPTAELHLERRVDFARLGPPEGLDGGTADITIWSGPELRDLETIDYKHGQGVYVEVQDNPQLLQYALATVVTDNRRPDSVRTTVIQPRHRAGEPVRSADYTWDDLIRFKAELFEAAEETALPDAPLAVGDWCRFCPAHAVCPAQASHTVQLAQVEFDELAEPGGADLLRDPKLLTPEDLAVVLEGAEHVEAWIKAARAHAHALIDRGGEVPGWKLVAGRANRKWADEQRAEQYMARKGLKVDERFTRKLVSPAQAEKALARAGHKTKFIQRFIEQPTGAPKLVRADDSRPALPSSAEADFADLTEE